MTDCPFAPAGTKKISSLHTSDEVRCIKTGDCRFKTLDSRLMTAFRDPAGTRTQDPNIKSVVLYQLSYGIYTRGRTLIP